MKPKAFDCVEMQHKAALEIYEETKDLSFEGKVEYWRRKSEEMTRRQQERLRRSAKRQGD